MLSLLNKTILILCNPVPDTPVSSVGKDQFGKGGLGGILFNLAKPLNLPAIARDASR
jgi:hypothetical protein